MESIITKNSKETQDLGKKLARKMKGGEAVCLSGELGSGKTTFTQGFLKELGAKGPYTSPTFLIMKEYKNSEQKTENRKQELKKHHSENVSNQPEAKSQKLKAIYHIDAYRVDEKDILNLGWEEIVADKNNVVIVEWAERIKKIVPENALWVKFEWLNEEERKIVFEN